MTRCTTRLVGCVGLLGLCLAGVAPSVARADTGTVGLQVGALAVTRDGATDLLPTLRAEAGLRLAGPLYGGAFLQGTAQALPFSNAEVAGGLFATLRFDLPGVGLKLFASGEAGRISLPSDTQGSAGAWSASAVGGVDVPILDGKLWLDFRGAHTWLFDLSSPSIGPRAWSFSAGVSIPLD